MFLDLPVQSWCAILKECPLYFGMLTTPVMYGLVCSSLLPNVSWLFIWIGVC